ncbi:hypothetical protein EDF24_0686 [Curtobacterium sp. PhB130]|uniref:hypothetical protein n=1 Tax=Curtobacterium sp. PhB130 TaxID=2485178 RepID=UPI000F4B6C2B|nr:hypothetical protein [Curtobacterium sp. PhB130]ROS77918.1 hypothetical protein EDF24_0686 [Curtobacterium sp. PhB130]
MTESGFRITTAQAKVGYVVGATVVEVLLALLLWAIGLPDAAVPFLSAIGLVAMVVGGVRLFRGEDEPVEPPRAWWRMTARPFAGFLLAAYFVADALCARASTIGAFDVLGTVVMLLVAAAYVGSSVTLLLLRAQGRPPAGAFEG